MIDYFLSPLKVERFDKIWCVLSKELIVGSVCGIGLGFDGGVTRGSMNTPNMLCLSVCLYVCMYV